MVSYLEPKFLNSKAYQTLTQTAAAASKAMVGKGAKLYKGDKRIRHSTALKALLDILDERCPKRHVHPTIQKAWAR